MEDKHKASLAREREKIVSPAEDIPQPSATVIDGMSGAINEGE